MGPGGRGEDLQRGKGGLYQSTGLVEDGLAEGMNGVDQQGSEEGSRPGQRRLPGECGQRRAKPGASLEVSMGGHSGGFSRRGLRWGPHPSECEGPWGGEDPALAAGAGRGVAAHAGPLAPN